MKATTAYEMAGRVKGKDLKVGQVLLVTDLGYQGALVLRTYGGFVNLKNPNQTWDNPSTNELTGFILPNGTQITLTVD